MLRPANGITNCRRFIRTGCTNECVSDLVEKRWRDAANLFDHLRCVACEMSFEFLENTLGILESEIPFGIAQSFALVFPRSEERRVGKEWRSRELQYHYRKKLEVCG